MADQGTTLFDWGVFGGALGTLFGQLVCGCLVLGYFIGPRSSMKLRLANIRPRGQVVASIFGLTPAEHEFGMTASVLFIVSMPVVPLAVIGSNYFQATGQPLKAMVLSLTRQFIFYVPLLYAMPGLAELVAPGTSGLMAITFTESAADFLAVIAVAAFQVLEGRRIAKLRRGQENGSVPAPVDFSKMAALED